MKYSDILTDRCRFFFSDHLMPTLGEASKLYREKYKEAKLASNEVLALADRRGKVGNVPVDVSELTNGRKPVTITEASILVARKKALMSDIDAVSAATGSKEKPIKL
ncbi:hypothetical protein HDV00_008780 [Rhizophlyctis rosea]|nr:hypothetical protein HDV00_008780 [Rhizophlyctis rosea]